MDFLHKHEYAHDSEGDWHEDMSRWAWPLASFRMEQDIRTVMARTLASTPSKPIYFALE
jgi:hypothetical protein